MEQRHQAQDYDLTGVPETEPEDQPGAEGSTAELTGAVTDTAPAAVAPPSVSERTAVALCKIAAHQYGVSVDQSAPADERIAQAMEGIARHLFGA